MIGPKWLGLAILGLTEAVCAQTVGEQHRLAPRPGAEARNADGRALMRLTIWYRAADGAEQSSIDIGPPGHPFFKLGTVAMDAAFADGDRRPVILLSHGFGGSARTMAWFGRAMADRGYVVIAVDHPGNNGIDAMTVPGATFWWERARDLRVALDAALADPVLAPHLDSDRIGVAGFSIGGLTALIAGGARLSPANLFSFCEANPTDGVCKPQIEFPIEGRTIRGIFTDPRFREHTARAGENYAIPRVRAVLAMAPVVQVADSQSLTRMRIPVAIITGANDVTVPVGTHAAVAKSLIPGARLHVIPDATHYSFLAECTAEGRAALPVCKDATAQPATHERTVAVAADLFDRELRGNAAEQPDRSKRPQVENPR